MAYYGNILEEELKNKVAQDLFEGFDTCSRGDRYLGMTAAMTQVPVPMTTKLSPFVGTFMPEEHRNTSGAYQGAKYFSYNGKVLDEIRKEKENIE